jgi:putative transposase
MFLEVIRMKKHLSGTEIVGKLRQADVLIAEGKTVPEVCREIGVTSQTYYRWRNKYGGMSPDMIKQLRELQKENTRLRRVVADQAVDIAILKEVAQGN